MIDKSVLHLLKLVKKLKKDEFSYFIEHLNDKSIDNICECVYNVVNTDIKLTKKKRNQLKKHIKSNCCISRIKRISSKKIPVHKRRQALKQEGKGLPLILASVIPFVASLLGK